MPLTSNYFKYSFTLGRSKISADKSKFSPNKYAFLFGQIDDSHRTSCPTFSECPVGESRDFCDLFVLLDSITISIYGGCYGI